MESVMIGRRSLLGAGAALTLIGAGGAAALSPATGDRKFILIILRGALDGLAAVAPYSEAEYRSLRGKLALSAPGTGADAVLPIAEGFGLHPSLKGLHAAWNDGALAILHACASPYRERSHFDGQDVLESGGGRVFEASDGWLNRALAAAPVASGREAVAIGSTVPLVLRGKAKASSWSPSFAPKADDDTVSRLMDLYAEDAVLGPALAQATATAMTVGASGMETAPNRGGRYGPAAYRGLTEAAAKIIAAPGGPIAAVVSFEGWDTHANQGAGQGQLAGRLQGLDAAIDALKTNLGPQWDKTVVVVATEFGRTVRENGTGGTDHGTGGVAFALGGAVRGGRLIGDWPGLKSSALYQNRDLYPANDVRALFATVLRDHWGVDRATLSRDVFRGAGGNAFDGLIRTS